MAKLKEHLPDLYIAGIGMNGLSQITRETQAVLQNCRVVFHYGEPHKKLASMCRRVVNLSDAYWTGDDRSIVYRRLASIVMDEVRKGPGVASITYGHPTLFDDVHMSLVRRCRRAGLKCVVLPAVSCLDTLCIDLNIDYGSPGLVVFEATDLVMNCRQMNTELHTLVLQVGEFNVATTTDKIVDSQGRFDDLDKYLLKYYPSGHKLVACYSNDGEGTVKFTARIGNLAGVEHLLFVGLTMYVPPL